MLITSASVHSTAMSARRAQTSKWQAGSEGKALLCLSRTLDVHGNDSRQHSIWNAIRFCLVQ